MFSVYKYLGTSNGVTVGAISILVLVAFIYILTVIKFRPSEWIVKLAAKSLRYTGRKVNKAERDYARNTEMGRYKHKSIRVRIYKFLNDLTIDLNLKEVGYTPHTLLLLISLVSLLVSIVISLIVFNNLWLLVFSYPLVLVTVSCFLYTKANIAHDARIDDVIAAENIISNSISKGVVVSVRQNLDSFPVKLQPVFREFVDNIETRNTHIKTALLELNNNLGSVADDFIQKCITFELEEEHGLVGIFNDVVEVNGIKSEFRIYMKRKFEDVMLDFIISNVMILFFLGGAISIYPILQKFYFKNIIGQLMLMADALIIIIEFVYITYLKAQEV